MASNFTNPKAKIIVVDPSGPVRQMMADTIRSVVGFEQVEGKTNIQDVLQMLETESADWLVLPLMADQPVNALHILKLCTETPALRHVRVSLLLGDDESYVVPRAFELGCLSYHHRPFTKDTLTSELKNLFAVLDYMKFNETLTAAHFLRHFFKTTKDYQSQADLEKSLLDLFPGDPQILLNLAEPQFHLGKPQLARKTLAQVKLLDEKLTDRVNDLTKALFGAATDLNAAADTSGDPNVNALGANNAVIVDSDEASGRGVEDILKSLGCPKIHRFSNGQEAWQHLEKNPEPDLIVTEWRVPKLTGPALIQRIRHHGFLNVPIVILSSLLKLEDAHLVKEIGVAEIIQKPLMKDVFIPALIWTMRQERLPTETQHIERKIRMLLKNGKKVEAETLRVQLLVDKQTSMARKRLIEAEFAFANAQYELARDAAVEALKLSGDNIHVLNILGKAFMRLSNFEAALKCFKKAQDMSPNYIERLCLMAESETELGNDKAAQEVIDQAQAVDSAAPAVTDAKVKVAITKGDSATAKKLMGSFESIENIVSYMNNKAVAFAKCGQGDDAIELYKKTAESVPDDQLDPKAIVLYNLALAKIRSGDVSGALVNLGEVMALNSTRMAKKTSSLMERLKVAQEKGQDFKLRSTDGPESKGAPTAAKPAEGAAPESEHTLNTEADYRRMLAMMEIKRGDFCCFMLFSSATQDVRVTSLLAKAPTFKSRSAIERQEAMSVDRSKAG